MKKTYNSPEIGVIYIKTNQQLLAGSLTVNMSTNSFEDETDDLILNSREADFDD